MVKLTKEQYQALSLLNSMLMKRLELNEQEKKLVSDFLSVCINNHDLNKAVFEMMIKEKDVPALAVYIVLAVSFKTRKLSEIEQTLEENKEIESLREYAIFRDIASLQKLFADLERFAVIDYNLSLCDLKNKIQKSWETIDFFEKRILDDDQELSHYFSLLVKLLNSPKKPTPQKPNF